MFLSHGALGIVSIFCSLSLTLIRLQSKMITTDFTEDTDFEEIIKQCSLTQKVSELSINSFSEIS